MSRKAIKGYPEKSYYDNTSFKGVHATLNPLNEGYFNQMINFDIDDTGQSIKPRAGFITTDLYIDDTIVLHPDTTLYFFDPNISKYIFIDFSTFMFNISGTSYSYTIDAYKVDFMLDNMTKHFTSVVKIKNIDLTDILKILGVDDTSNWSNIAESVKKIKFLNLPYTITSTEDLITKFIVKVEPISDLIPYTFLELYYREKSSVYEDVTYKEDTLIVSYVDTENTGSIDISQRNIASTQSIIPDPMQKVYSKDSKDLPYNQFPFIYVQESTSKKYLISDSVSDDLIFTPHYLLNDNDSNYTWGYSYDFISSQNTEDIIYRSPIFKLDNSSILDNSYINRLTMYNSYIKTIEDITMDTNINVPGYEDTVSGILISKNSYTYDDYARVVKPILLPYLFDLFKYNGSHLIDPDKYFGTSIGPIDNNKYTKYYKYFTSSYFLNSAIIYIVPTISDTHTIDFTENTTTVPLDTFLNNIQGKISNNTNVWNPYNFDKHADAIISIFNYNDYTSIDDLFKKLDTLNLQHTNVRFFIAPVSNITNMYSTEATNDTTPDNVGLYNTYQYAFTSNIYSFKATELLTYDDLKKELIEKSSYNSLFFKTLSCGFNIAIGKEYAQALCKHPMVSQFFPSIHYLKEPTVYYIGMTRQFASTKNIWSYFYNWETPDSNINLGTDFIPSYGSSESGHNALILSAPSCVFNVLSKDNINLTDPSLFDINDDLLQLNFSNIKSSYHNGHTLYTKLSNSGFFNTGINIVMYLLKVPKLEYYLNNPYYTFDVYDRTYLVSTTNLIQTRPVYFINTPPTFITEKLEDEPLIIKNASKFLVFNSDIGAHLVVYNKNKIYVSEPNTYYYFKYTGVFSVDEPILKIIQFKNILLIFTPQTLYALYPITTTVQKENGVDDEGNPRYISVDVTEFGILPVLYNLMVSEQYLDAIQVFNQMVLFYSADGQLFLIKPTATIDSDTKFSIQYFNKAANDILLNYDKYMYERMKVYNILHNKPYIPKAHINIKVQVNINFIKIYYTYLNYTYILIYDIINNYFYIYDTCAFSNLNSILNTSYGDIYITARTINENDKRLVFTKKKEYVYGMDTNYDEDIYYNLVDTPIELELDTGTLNLNTHLKKRFRDLRIIYKNLGSSKLKYSLDVFIDDILTDAYLEDQIVVNSNDGQYIYDLATIDKTENVLSDTSILFNLSDFTSNKIITHYTSIPCLGKFFRARFRFSTKGYFKLLGYGLVFKEHQI